MRSKKKIPFYKRWRVYAYTFAAIVLFGWILDVTGWSDANDAKIAAETEVKVKAVEAQLAVNAEKNAKVEAEAKVRDANTAKAEAAKKAKAKADATVKAADVDEKLAVEIALIKELTEGIVVAVEKSPYGQDDWMITWVTVSDDWYDSEAHVKERFADQIGAQVKASLYAAGAVKQGDPILVHFYDINAKELAKEKIFGGYDIKR
ncbi:hypothetical protein [Sporosarcina psychrophila]|uniref:Uncharacterized protein n=1 Tax=Sporosarcina psychrophila TaxID=1476 RepID=A0ABV2KC36_SPOPS